MSSLNVKDIEYINERGYLQQILVDRTHDKEANHLRDESAIVCSRRASPWLSCGLSLLPRNIWVAYPLAPRKESQWYDSLK